MTEQALLGIGKLALALSKAQGTIKNAVKDADNPAFKRGEVVTKYADLASVWDACRAALTSNEIAVIQQVSGGPDTVTVSTVLAHSSGESISCSVTGKPTKNDVQGIGSTITYLRRYSLAAMVGVAPEDDDGNAATGKQPDTKTEAKAKELSRATKEAEKATLYPFNACDGSEVLPKPAGAFLTALAAVLKKSDDPEEAWSVNMESFMALYEHARTTGDAEIMARCENAQQYANKRIEEVNGKQAAE